MAAVVQHLVPLLLLLLLTVAVLCAAGSGSARTENENEAVLSHSAKRALLALQQRHARRWSTDTRYSPSGSWSPHMIGDIDNENHIESEKPCDPLLWQVQITGEEKARNLPVKLIYDKNVVDFYDYANSASRGLGIPSTAVFMIAREYKTEQEFIVVVYNAVVSEGQKVRGATGSASVEFDEAYMLVDAKLLVKDDEGDQYNVDELPLGFATFKNDWNEKYSDGFVLGPIKKYKGECFKTKWQWKVPQGFWFKLGWGDEIPSERVKEMLVCRPDC